MPPRDIAGEFLEAHGFRFGDLDPEALLSDMLREMTRGLAGSDSSLAMLPTYIGVDQPVPSRRPVIAVDAGGTNLRSATVSFDETGTPVIEGFSKQAMPGTDGELDRDAFFERFAQILTPLAASADTVGFCFSYAIEIDPDHDGRLLYWTKGIRAPEIVGERIGAGVAKHLRVHGHEKGFVLLNDTIATLLAAKSVGDARQYESYIGFILGTGTNTAYVEKNANIRKCSGLDPEQSQAINVESGRYTGCPRSEFDKAVDAASANPGGQQLEKMVSGAYLGTLAGKLLEVARADGLLSAGCADIAAGLELSTKGMDDFLHNPHTEKPFPSGAVTGHDREILYRLFSAIVQRAAMLAAVSLGAAVLKADAGRNPLHPVCVNADGSTFHKTKGLRGMVATRLREILQPRGVFFDLLHVEDAPLIGAAVAGLTIL